MSARSSPDHGAPRAPPNLTAYWALRLSCGHRLDLREPPLLSYLRLRDEAGLTPRNSAQAEPALVGTWYGVHVIHDQTGDVAAMGRVIGDGRWYFHVADMATLPDHQRRGLGDLVLTALLDHIREVAPPGAWVCLMADPPGRRLYERHGFTDGQDSTGMARWLA